MVTWHSRVAPQHTNGAGYRYSAGYRYNASANDTVARNEQVIPEYVQSVQHALCSQALSLVAQTGEDQRGHMRKGPSDSFYCAQARMIASDP